MATKASSTTENWRKNMKLQGFKNLQVWVHESSIAYLDTLQKSLGMNRSEALAHCIQYTMDNVNREKIQEPTRNESALFDTIRKQLEEKDALIRNQTEQINNLIKQNDQSQQLIAGFSKIGEQIKLLENPKKNKKKEVLETSKGSSKTSSKDNSRKRKSKKKRKK
ncbi:hypothetical protein H8D83_01590 [Candidatus Woesearchaeota archaeon]|nr:hypothetical protein [Candidatus Woesearchaeota archaeon]